MARVRLFPGVCIGAVRDVARQNLSGVSLLELLRRFIHPELVSGCQENLIVGVLAVIFFSLLVLGALSDLGQEDGFLVIGLAGILGAKSGVKLRFVHTQPLLDVGHMQAPFCIVHEKFHLLHVQLKGHDEEETEEAELHGHGPFALRSQSERRSPSA